MRRYVAPSSPTTSACSALLSIGFVAVIALVVVVICDERVDRANLVADYFLRCILKSYRLEYTEK